jgi:hypothetical protein
MLVPFSGSPASAQAIHEAGVDPAAIRAADQRDGADEARMLRAAARTGIEVRPAVPTADANRLARAAMMRFETAAETTRRTQPRIIPLGASAQ